MHGLIEPRSSAGIAVLAGEIYAVGGLHGETYLRSVERYDLLTNQWMLAGNLVVGRAGHRCATINGSIFAVGGWNSEDNYLHSVERYDSHWTLVSRH